MNYDEPYFSNISGVNMLILWTIISYTFLWIRQQLVQDCVVFILNFCGFLLVAGVHLIEIH